MDSFYLYFIIPGLMILALVVGGSLQAAIEEKTQEFDSKATAALCRAFGFFLPIAFTAVLGFVSWNVPDWPEGEVSEDMAEVAFPQDWVKAGQEGSGQSVSYTYLVPENAEDADLIESAGTKGPGDKPVLRLIKQREADDIRIGSAVLKAGRAIVTVGSARPALEEDCALLDRACEGLIVNIKAEL